MIDWLSTAAVVVIILTLLTIPLLMVVGLITAVVRAVWWLRANHRSVPPPLDNDVETWHDTYEGYEK